MTLACRLCEIEQPLIKAHIIPEGFFRVLRDGPSPPEVHTNRHGAHPKRAPIGIYDKTILCASCDNTFSPWDNYAQKVLLQEFSNARALRVGSATVGWQIESVDYRLLKLFFISLLWRASVSGHEFYGRVSVGAFEGELQQMIRSLEPGNEEAFAVTIAKFDHPALTGMLDPHPERYESINYCRFYLAGFVAYIKVDRRVPPEFLRDFVLRPNAPLTILARSARSKDTAVMREIAQAAWKAGRGR